MKKKLLFILLFMMFIPYFVYAETCDQDKISIGSITVEDKSDNVEEIDEAVASGKNINLNLSMSEVGDNIDYKITIKNESDEDYILDMNSLKSSSEYINYVLESEDGSNLVKANSSKVVYLKVNYTNEVPEDKFDSGSFNDNKKLTLSLANGDTSNVPDTLINPKTGVQYFVLIIVIILLVSFIIFIMNRNKKSSKFIVLIIGVTILIPISAYALCKCDIKIESNVKIKNNSFTGTLYRHNIIILRNGSNLSGYLLKSSNIYRNVLYNTKEECNENLINDEVCEKVQDSILNYTGFSLDKESLDRHVFLRHDVVNNIIKSTYICYLDGQYEYCMLGGDNGDSFSSNEQVIRDFSNRNSYCTMFSDGESIGCEGSYGMKMFTYRNGKVSAAYYFAEECNIESDGTSKCLNN